MANLCDLHDLTEKLSKIFEIKTTLETSVVDGGKKINVSLNDLVKLTKSVFLSQEILKGLKDLEQEVSYGFPY
jgi:hypothetical protein